jgi:hypothetical protein
MEVQLTFNARQQLDKGGPLSIAIKQASTLLEADALPKGVAKLTKEEAIEEGLLDEEELEDDEEEEDDDDDDEDDDEEEADNSGIWVLPVGNTNVYFSQPEEDGTKTRLILRAV